MSLPSETRHERLHLRLSPSDDGLIRAAAQTENLSLTEFVIRAARASATQTLAERDHVVLDPDTWDQLDARVRRRGRRNPRVAKLFSRPVSLGD
ncbi:MAG: type II toxin-antitoxin system TacA family antitoxin [Acidimicrobiales bacterium]